jgi:GNAT superfamily N-acetyltransferase
VPSSNSSLINAVVPNVDASVAPHLDEIERFYADIPKWGVWNDPGNAADAGALRDTGLVLDSTPVLMATPVKSVERTPDPRVGRVTLEEIGAVNDAAYGIPSGTIGSALAGIRPSDVRPYGIRDGDEAVSVAVVQDVDDDAFVTFVATLPDHRGNRLASTILSAALHESDARTTSLQASKLGQSIYARLGYRPLGEIHLYEKRPA